MKNTSLTEMLDRCVHEILKGVNTCIPGQVLSFNPSKQLAQVQMGISKINYQGKEISPPPIILVPVLFYGGDYAIECQIDKGNEGLIVFSQRCIDSWIDQGGVSKQKYKRFHDSNDALFIPGFRSQKNKLIAFQNNGIRLRDKSGNSYIWLKNDGTAEIQVSNLNLLCDMTHTGNTTQTGNYESSGTITAPNVVGTTNVTFGGISGAGHRHTHGPDTTSTPI